jgi:hypothetical protein
MTLKDTISAAPEHQHEAWGRYHLLVLSTARICPVFYSSRINATGSIANTRIAVNVCFAADDAGGSRMTRYNGRWPYRVPCVLSRHLLQAPF